MSDNATDNNAKHHDIGTHLKDTYRELQSVVEQVKPLCLQITDQIVPIYTKARELLEPAMAEALAKAQPKYDQVVGAARANRLQRLCEAREAFGRQLQRDPGNCFMGASRAESPYHDAMNEYLRAATAIGKIHELCSGNQVLPDLAPEDKLSTEYLLWAVCTELKQPHRQKWEAFSQAGEKEYKSAEQHMIEGDARGEPFASLTATEALIEADYQRDIARVSKALQYVKLAIERKRERLESAFRPLLQGPVTAANELFDLATGAKREQFKWLATVYLNQQIVSSNQPVS